MCNKVPRDKTVLNWNIIKARQGGEREGGPIYGLYRYVPQDGVWFLRLSILK